MDSLSGFKSVECAAQVKMAKGPSGRASRAPLLVFLSLLLFLLSGTLTAQELPTNGVNGFSLHPPYFNLAEGTKITATATCGVDENEHPIQDLYCKLVGGPVSGDPSQTIQVKMRKILRFIVIDNA